MVDREPTHVGSSYAGPLNDLFFPRVVKEAVSWPARSLAPVAGSQLGSVVLNVAKVAPWGRPVVGAYDPKDFPKGAPITDHG